MVTQLITGIFTITIYLAFELFVYKKFLHQKKGLIQVLWEKYKSK